MPTIQRDGFYLHYEVTFEGYGPTLLLIAGLGEQIGAIEYPREYCELFAQRGFRVVRMDNRDAGLSLPVNEDGEVADYTLLDVADDVAAVIEDLNCDGVHIVGASMGGFIVRWTAIRRPDLINSLTVVMSGSGADNEQQGPLTSKEAVPSLLGMFVPRGRAEQIDWSTQNWRYLWGDKHPFPEAWVRDRISASFDRSYTPDGVARLLNASRQTRGLWEAQAQIACPTLVMHGGQDPIFSAEHGRAIAAQIPGAELWLDERMGHTMHDELWEEMVSRVAAMAGI